MKRIVLFLFLALATVASWAAALIPIDELEDVEITFTSIDDLATKIGNVSGSKKNLILKKDASFTGDLSAVDFKNNVLEKISWNIFAGLDLKNLTELAGYITNGSVKFNGKDYLTQILLPSGITKIPENCFDGCTSLIRVSEDKTAFSGVTEVGNLAFNGCNNFEGDDFSSVTKVGQESFQNCSKLESITLNNNVTEIGRLAFSNSGLTSSPFTSGMTSLRKIETGLFKNCQNLTETVVFPEGVETVSDNIFGGTNVKKVEFPSTVEGINMDFAAENKTIEHVTVAATNNIYGAESDLLYKKENKEIVYAAPAQTGTITIPEDLTSIAEYAFRENQATKIVLNNVTSVGGKAFINSNVEEIGISEELQWVGGAFDEAKKLKKFTGNGGEYYTTADGILYNKDKTELVRCPIGMTKETFTNITLPEDLKTIGDASFKGCTDLTEINVPNSVEKLGNDAFSDCTGLTSFKFPKSLKNFAKSAPFAGCTNLSSFTMDGNGNDDFVIVDDSKLYSNDKTILYLYAAAAEGAKPVLDYHLQEVWTCAFANNQHIEELKLPQGVTVINASAFKNSNIKTFIIPHSVYFMGNDAFRDCEHIEDIYVLPTARVMGYNISQKDFYNGEGRADANCLYGTKNLENIKVHVSDDYTTNNDGKSLIEAYQTVKANGVSWGDIYDKNHDHIVALNHRALTEVPKDSPNLGYSNPREKNSGMKEANYPFITLYYDFSGDQPYFTLGVPFSATLAQVKAALGEGTKVYTFQKRNKRTMEFKKATTDDETVIEAGTAVLVKPSNTDVKSFLFDLRETTSVNAKSIGDGLGSGTQKTSNNLVSEDEGVVNEYNYSFKSTYLEGKSMPQGSYYVATDGKLHYVTNPNGTKIKKALRGYVAWTGTESTGAKAINTLDFAIEDDGVMTVINAAEVMPEVYQTNSDVYSVNGQLVRANATSLEGLPAGLYIVNGKKVFVK